jgi:phosphoketolase
MGTDTCRRIRSYGHAPEDGNCPDRALQQIIEIKINDAEGQRPCSDWSFENTQRMDGSEIRGRGLPVEGSFRLHQVPLSNPANNPDHLTQLEEWLKSYKPEELFDEQGKLKKELKELAPEGNRRMGANPHTNGGLLLRDLSLPDFKNYALTVEQRGIKGPGDTLVLGKFIRDVIKENLEYNNFRLFVPTRP